MPIQKQLMPVAFKGGIDTKSDPKHVIPGKLLDLQNGIFQQTGAINRRWGYTKLGQNLIGGTKSITSAKAITAFNNELLLYDGARALSYLPSVDAWAQRGTMVSVIQTNQSIVRNTSQQLSPDYANLNGIDVFAWEDSRGGIRYSVLDSPTGAIILGDQPLYAGAPSTLIRPKCVPCASISSILIFFTDGAGAIGCVPIPTANPTSNSGPIVVLRNAAINCMYDVAVGSLYGNVWIFYQYLDVTFGVTYYRAAKLSLTASFIGASYNIVFSVLVDGLGGSTAKAMCAAADAGDRFYFTYAKNSGDTYTTVIVDLSGAAVLGTRGPFLTSTQAFGAIASIACVPNLATSTQVFTEVVGANGNVVYSNTIDQFGTTGVAPASAPVFARGVGLASKPFTYNGSVYVNVTFDSQQQRTYFTLDASGNVVAKANAGLGGGYIANSDFMLPECQNVSPGQYEYANLVKGTVNTEAGQVLSLLGVNTTNLDFLHSNNFLSVGMNGNLYTVGGILQSYDGSTYVEHGFHLYPEGFTLTPSASGGLLGTGTYFYAVTYEWVDNNGGRQISTPSIATSTVFASGTTNSVSLTIPTLRLTRKSKVQIVIYRTTANGTLLYRVTSAALPTYSDPTVDTVTFVDTLADGSITSNGLMYTQPLTVGSNPILPNAAPPSCSLIATYDDRVWIAGLDDAYTLWYTKQPVLGVPMEFSAVQNVKMDPDGGPITAIARMDDKLVVFKKNAIFYLSGQGPTGTGDLSQIGSPTQIPSGQVGCASPNAIISTPVGLIFQSLNGIYLLDRGLNVSYKGAPVEAYNGLTITSCALVPNQWIIFTTTTGLALVYDYYYDQWSTFTNHAAVDSDIYLGSNDAYVFANASGQVFKQAIGTFSDAGAAIPFSLTTSWFALGGLQGFQRVYHAFLLGTYKGAHNLNFWCGFDYDDAFTQLAAIQAATTLGVSTFGSTSPFGSDAVFGGAPGASVYQFRVDVLRKCQAMRIQLTDFQVAPGNEGFSLSGISLVVGVKQGGNKLPAIKQFGAG